MKRRQKAKGHSFKRGQNKAYKGTLTSNLRLTERNYTLGSP